MSTGQGASGEQIAKVGEIELAYDELGDPSGEPMLLIMGLGTQLIHWNPAFCELLGERGYRVIRFDNRDVGHSTTLDSSVPEPHRDDARASARARLHPRRHDRRRCRPARRLEIGSAHLVGASMGGMIAQVAGYRHPDRVRSLGLIMTGSGKRIASLPRMRAMGTMLAKPAARRATPSSRP